MVPSRRHYALPPVAGQAGSACLHATTCSRYLGGMSTTLQICSVDDEFAAAAKAEAARRRMSLSAYLKELIRQDLARSSAGLSQWQVLTDEQAERAVDQHLRAGFTIERDSEDVRQAWRWRASMSLPDAWYAALAGRHGVPWVTTDHRAAATARRFGVEVTKLG
ncbi:hypothetical protein BH23ACT6_BH23ACT6_18740 [soil metagenome]